MTTDEPAYYAPDSLTAARQRLEAADDPLVIAGGQTLMLLLRQGFVDADALVDVTRVPSMSGISTEGDTATVGATATYADLADHSLADRVGMLGDACAVIADRQVRNAGTVGGAVCHADPSFDVLAPLLAIAADLRLVGDEGTRRLPLSEFLVGHMQTALRADELLESIRFEVPGPARGSAYEKHAPVEGGWTTVGAAAAVEVEDGTFTDPRVALAAVGDTTVRARSVEAALAGEPADDDAIEAASGAVVEDVDPIDDRAGSAAYKRRLAETLVERSLATARDRAGGDR